MASSAIRLRFALRQLASCLIAYSLVLQSILVGVATASAFAEQTYGLPGFELCLHKSDGEAGTPSDKSDRHDVHCSYCVLGALKFLAAPDSTAPAIDVAGSSRIDRRIADWRDAISPQYPSQRPRAPPTAA